MRCWLSCGQAFACLHVLIVQLPSLFCSFHVNQCCKYIRLHSLQLPLQVRQVGTCFELESLRSVATEIHPNRVSLKLSFEMLDRFMGLWANGAVDLNISQQSLVEGGTL